MQRGSLAQLRLLNRPAILMLTDDARHRESGGAARLGGRYGASCSSARTSASVGLADLTRYWFGDFVLLWHPVAKDVRDLRSGMRGAPVRSCAHELKLWSGGGSDSSTSDEYDRSLVQLVEQFQHAQSSRRSTASPASRRRWRSMRRSPRPIHPVLQARADTRDPPEVGRCPSFSMR